MTLRETIDALTVRLHGTLSQRAIEETARRLGLKRALESDLDRAVVLESAIYDQTISGTTAVSRMLARAKGDEKTILQAMLDARVTVLVALERIDDEKTRVGDVLSGDELVLADRTVAEVASPGDAFAARVLRLPEVAVTSGVPLALPNWALGVLARAGALPASAWKSRAQIATVFYKLALTPPDDLKEVLAELTLTGKDPLSLAVARALTSSSQ